jgi:adenylate cyclase
METSTEPTRLTRPAVQRRRIPVAVILALSFGTLVFLSVGGVLALSVSANYRNTTDLLAAQSNLLVDAMEESLRDHMSGVEAAVNGLAELYAQGAFDIDDGGAMTDTLSGALASVPEATGIFIYTDDLMQRGVFRTGEGESGGAIQIAKPNREKSPQVEALLRERRLTDARAWNDFVVNEYGIFANVSQPLIRDGVRRGLVVAPVELQTLSRITRDLSGRLGTHAFILDGDDRVLAHSELAEAEAKTRGIVPLMPLKRFDDPVLAHYAEREQLEELRSNANQNFEISEITLDGAGNNFRPWTNKQNYFVITRQVQGYGERPWTIGAYYSSGDVGDEIMRAWLSTLVGLGALLLAVVAAILLGKRLSRPVKVIAGQAQRVANFELDDVTPLPPSRVQELDDQAQAFNAMLVGLRAFSTYIPRSLVAKLVRTGEIGVTESHEAIVTVMFTDIAGFTALSEEMGAAEAARLLNHHFAILCGAVDEQGGTVDKFLGDGMMAFFGAPDRLKGHAAAAVRAAAVIREKLEADNEEAVAAGRPRLRVRIGIHTGPAIVGNIGASDRVNYTIVGDTVNVSQRLQELGKLLAPDQPTAILISGETASRLDDRFETIPAGKHKLRGRGGATEVYVVGAVELTEATLAKDASAA